MPQLRLSSHRVCIETGRWNQHISTPINKRICICCQYIEDEYRFIIECNPYIELRKQRIPIYYWKHPNMLKCTEPITCTNARILSNFGSYVNTAFTLRNGYYIDNMSHQFKYVKLVFSNCNLICIMVLLNYY